MAGSAIGLEKVYFAGNKPFLFLALSIVLSVLGVFAFFRFAVLLLSSGSSFPRGPVSILAIVLILLFLLLLCILWVIFWISPITFGYGTEIFSDSEVDNIKVVNTWLFGKLSKLHSVRGVNRYEVFVKNSRGRAYLIVGYDENGKDICTIDSVRPRSYIEATKIAGLLTELVNRPERTKVSGVID